MTSQKPRFSLRLLAVFALAGSATAQTPVPVWTSGTEGYHTYRIPAIIRTPGGDLLAFCEARVDRNNDSGEIRILAKRSKDGGRTWGVQAVVASFAGDTLGNPAPVVDRKTGVIWLLATRNYGSDSEEQILARTSRGTRTVWVMRSRDDGRTWSKPGEITEAVKARDWTWYATGPGAGIQLRDGRLMVSCDHHTGDARGYYSHVIYSDDHGRSWKLGGSVGPGANESAVVELPGRLMLNMRNAERAKRRWVSYSTDRGLTWSPPSEETALVDPICHASLIRMASARLLAFSNPASEEREALTVKFSRDNGNTWPQGVLIHAGPAAYSSLVELPGGAGVLYEAGEQQPYESILFDIVRVPDTTRVLQR